MVDNNQNEFKFSSISNLVKKIRDLNKVNLTADSFLDRETRKLVKFLFRNVEDPVYVRELYNELNSNTETSDMLDLLIETDVKGEYSENINTVGLYTLFCILNMVDLLNSPNKFKYLTDYYNKLFSVHEKYKCVNLFVGVPGSAATKLTAQDVCSLTTFSNRQFVDMYKDFYMLLSKVILTKPNDRSVVTISYDSVHVSSSVSLPEMFMDAMGFTTYDSIFVGSDVEAFLFTHVVDSEKNIYEYTQLESRNYPTGVRHVTSTDTMNDNEAFALLVLNGSSAYDEFRNKAVLLMSDDVSNRVTLRNAVPDYSYVKDINVPILVEDPKDDGEDLDLGSEIDIDKIVKDPIWTKNTGYSIYGCPALTEVRYVATELAKLASNKGCPNNKVVDYFAKQIAKSERDIAILQAKLRHEKIDDSIPGDCSSVTKKLEEANDKIKNLEIELAKHKDNDTTDCSNKLKKANEELEKAKKEVTEYKDKLEKTKEELDKIKNGDTTENNKKIDELEKDVKEKENKVSELKDELKKEKEKSSTCDKRVSELTEENKKLKRQIEENDNGNGGGSNSSTKRELEEAKDKIEKLEKQLQECRRNGGSRNVDLENCSEELSRTKRKVKELQEEVDRLVKADTTEGGYYKQELGRQREKVKMLENELDKLYEELYEARKCCGKLDEASRKIKDLETETTTQRKRIRELESEHSKHESTIKELNKTIKEKEEKISELEKHRNEESSKDCKEIQKDLERTKEMLHKTEKDKKDLMDRVRRLEKELEDKDKDKDEDGDGGDNNSSGSCSRVKRELEEMKKLLNKLEEEKFECKERIKQLERELEDARRGRDDNGHNNNNGKYPNTSKIIKELKEDLERARAKIKELEEDLDREHSRKIGGSDCELELVRVRNRIKILEKEVEAHKEFARIYKHELEYERNRFICCITAPTCNIKTNPHVITDIENERKPLPPTEDMMKPEEKPNQPPTEDKKPEKPERPSLPELPKPEKPSFPNLPNFEPPKPDVSKPELPKPEPDSDALESEKPKLPFPKVPNSVFSIKKGPVKEIKKFT
ncbi:a-type inclusion protein [Pteropox virus]|uniref:A-type inclusion protein n=1 Tax=Pteropox virus TaxID=1873698 RepID=A0A1B1MRJ0_9POXV|nr:a-type inclusion protein [Pteropox virus]ANS71204.1 a-type inclusion protein [Pteropox virus]